MYNGGKSLNAYFTSTVVIS